MALEISLLCLCTVLGTALSADILSVAGDTVFGLSFQLVCRTNTTYTANYADFWKSNTSGSLQGRVAYAAFYPENQPPCEPSRNVNYYDVTCADDGSEMFLTIPANNTAEHRTYWRCRTDTDRRFEENNEIEIYIKIPPTSVQLTDQYGNKLADNIAVRESESGFPVLCNTGPDGSRPEANISWWLTSSNGKTHQISENVTELPSTPLTGDMVISRSQLVVADKSYNGQGVFCRATLVNNVQSSIIKFSVSYGPGQSVRVSNRQYVLHEGQTAEPISCEADCNPTCSYRWFKDDALIDNDAMLNLGVVEKSDAGEYKCEAYLTFQGQTYTAQRSVFINIYYPPEIISISGSGTYDVNTSFTLTCSVDAIPDPNISWYKQGDNQPLQSDVTTTSSLPLEQVDCHQMSNYICQADNGLGHAKETAEVLIKCPPAESSPHDPTRYSSSGSQIVLAINTVSYRLPSFVWRDPTSAIIVEDSDQYKQNDRGDSSTLTIRDLLTFGTYTVTVSNGISPDATFDFIITERGTEDSTENCTGQSLGLTLGMTVVGLVVGLVSMMLVCKCWTPIRTRCCPERLYMEPKPKSGEHTYAEVSGHQVSQHTGSSEGNVKETNYELQTYENT